MASTLAALLSYFPQNRLRPLLEQDPAVLLISASLIHDRMAALKTELGGPGAVSVVRSKPQLLLMSSSRIAAQREGLARVLGRGDSYSRDLLRSCPSLLGYSLATVEAKEKLVMEYAGGSEQWLEEVGGWSPAAWGNVLRAGPERYHRVWRGVRGGVGGAGGGGEEWRAVWRGVWGFGWGWAWLGWGYWGLAVGYWRSGVGGEDLEALWVSRREGSWRVVGELAEGGDAV